MTNLTTRFAPSPTGYIHIGNVRSAIYPYLLAKQTGGKFLLRIEDTDQSRFVPGATDLILDTLRWLGLDWDEGPEIGGPHAPYFQTERKSFYLDFAKKLIEKGRAYVDPTPSETVGIFRASDNAKKIPYLFRNHRPLEADFSPEKTLELFKTGAFPLRFKSDPKPRSWTDAVMGDMHAGPEVQDDIILIKKDGLPTYNFAHIVDDFLMEVNVIMRGVEYLSSTPNYLALYEALEIKPPILASLPHILAPSGNKKLGKRDGAKSVTEYRDAGVLPEAMLNYLACLGWNDGTETEIYTKSELIDAFSLEKIQTSGARFDEVKIYWYNGQWLRRLVTEEGIEKFYSRTNRFWPTAAEKYDDAYKKRVLSIIYDRLKVLSDLRDMTGYFFADPEVRPELLLENKFLKKAGLSESDLVALLETSLERLEKLSDSAWTAENLKTALNELLETTGRKPAELFSLLRISVSFAPFSPALDETFAVLGRATVSSRLRAVKSALLLDGE